MAIVLLAYDLEDVLQWHSCMLSICHNFLGMECLIWRCVFFQYEPPEIVPLQTHLNSEDTGNVLLEHYGTFRYLLMFCQ